MLIHNLVATGSISYNGVNISYVTGSQTSLDGLNQFSASVNTTTGSLNSTTGSLNTATGSLFTASGSFSTRVSNIEGNYATTGSNVFLGAQTVCANITSTGTIIAQTLNVQQVTSSIVYSSGSNIFGCSTSDVQQITGSLRMTGSIATFSTNCFGIGTSTPLAYNNYVALTVGDNSTTKTGLIKLRSCYNAGDGAEVYQTTAGTLTVATNGSDSAFRIFSNNIASFTCQTCAPGIDIMPSGIGVSTLGGIMRVVTTGTSTGIAVGQSNSNRYTHFAANDIQVFNDDFFLTTRCAFPLSIGTCYTARLTFAATGIACFSCQVCAPQGIFINGAASLQAQFGQNNDATGTQTSAIDIISRNAANTAGFTFRIQNCATTCTTHLVYSGNTVMAFRCDGNVGIGMTSPQAPLHIIKALGNDVISIGETGTNTRFTIGQEASYTGNYINSRNIDLKIQAYCAGGSGGNIIFQTANDGTANVVERMRITSAGCVGIGTPSPNGLLHIQQCRGGEVGFRITNSQGAAGNTSATVAINMTLQNGSGGSSGVVQLIAGKESDHQSAANVDDYFAIATTSNDTTTERMRITSAGYVTKPYQVAFKARNSNNITVNTDAKITLDTTDFNVGSGYSTSTGIFTAPVAGKYLFNFASTAIANGLYQYNAVYLIVNGAATGVRFRGPGCIPTNSWFGIAGSIILDLSASGTVQINGYTEASSMTLHINETNWTGYLLG